MAGQGEVLNELNRRITGARNTVHVLHGYLSRAIGKFRCRIGQKQGAAGHGATWWLLESGLERLTELVHAHFEGERGLAQGHVGWEYLKGCSAEAVASERAGQASHQESNPSLTQPRCGAT